MGDPEVLLKCRETFEEGQWYYDVRVGPVRLETLTADMVVFVSEEEMPLDMGDAGDLLEAYQNGSIQPIGEHDP